MSDAWGKLTARAPLLRLCLAFISGIIFAGYVNNALPAVIAIVSLAVIYVILWRLSNTPNRRSRFSPFLTLIILLVAALVGILCDIANRPAPLNNKQINGKLAITRINTVKFGEARMTINATIIYIDDDKSTLPNNNIIIYCRGENRDLHAGDLVIIKTALDSITNLGNPHESDYASMQHNAGIFFSTHLSQDELVKCGSAPTFSTRMENLRRIAEDALSEANMAEPTKAMMIALLLGNRDYISDNISTEYSLAGLAHILALSGLHVAIISLIVWFLLFPLDYLKAKKLRYMLTVVSLILFDALTGFSPSVVRATVMISVLLTSYVFFRRYSPINAILLAAILILLFYPRAIYNAGFQLSFITVLMLIVVYPRLQQMLNINNMRLSRLVSIIITSLIAMISTIILTAYYFGTMSFYSVLANIVVLPIFPIIVIVFAFQLFCLLLGYNFTLLSTLCDICCSFVGKVAGIITQLPGSHLNDVTVSASTCIIFYILVALLVVWLYTSRRNILWIMMAMLIVLTINISLLSPSPPNSEYYILNDRQLTPIFFHEQKTGYLWIADAKTDYAERYLERNRTIFNRFHLDSVLVINDSARCGTSIISGKVAALNSHRIMVIDGGRWKGMTSNETLRVDEVVISRNFISSIKAVNEHVKMGCVVLSGNIEGEQLQRLANECAEIGVKCYSLKERGAYKLDRPQLTRPAATK